MEVLFSPQNLELRLFAVETLKVENDQIMSSYSTFSPVRAGEGRVVRASAWHARAQSVTRPKEFCIVLLFVLNPSMIIFSYGKWHQGFYWHKWRAQFVEAFGLFNLHQQTRQDSFIFFILLYRISRVHYVIGASRQRKDWQTIQELTNRFILSAFKTYFTSFYHFILT